MHNQKILRIAIDILLVSSWGLSFLGFTIGLYLFMPFGFLGGVCGAIFMAIPGLFIVVAVELFFIQRDKLNESKRQSEILKSIEEKLDKLSNN